MYFFSYLVGSFVSSVMYVFLYFGMYVVSCLVLYVFSSLCMSVYMYVPFFMQVC